MSPTGHPKTPMPGGLVRPSCHEAGVVRAPPEYHGSFCAMIKLIIENLGFPSAIAGRPVALLGVAAGRIGAIKSLEHLRGCAHTWARSSSQVPLSIAGVPAADKYGDWNEGKRLAGISDPGCFRPLLQWPHRLGTRPSVVRAGHLSTTDR
jgi:hypothetical protein